MPTLDNVSLDIAVVLGTTAMPIHQVLRLGRGAIIELDATEDDEVKILANNFPVAKGTWWSRATGSRSRSRSCCRARPRRADPIAICESLAANRPPLLYGRGRFVTSRLPRRRPSRLASNPLRPWRNW